MISVLSGDSSEELVCRVAYRRKICGLSEFLCKLWTLNALLVSVVVGLRGCGLIDED